MTKEQVKRGRGQPRIQFDPDELRRVANLQPTVEELAAFFECSDRTIQKRIKKDKQFVEMLERGKAGGRLSLRRAQWRNAVGTKERPGNPTMQIWLGKQWLGQKDSITQEHTGPGGSALSPPVIQVSFIDPPIRGDINDTPDADE